MRLSLTASRMKMPSKNPESILSGWDPWWVVHVYTAFRIAPGIFVRLLQQESPFLLWSSWKKVQKCTEETAKLCRPPLPKRNLSDVLKIPQLNTNQGSCS